MKSEVENDVIEFQTWLSQSIRRAWILAFAVAIPGAFLLTHWFPHSPEALLMVALLGIAIGVISDAVENAKKQRRDELSQIRVAVRQAVQDGTASIHERVIRGVESALNARPTVRQSSTESTADPAANEPLEVTFSWLSVYEQLEAIHLLLVTILKRLSTEGATTKEHRKGTDTAKRPLPGLETPDPSVTSKLYGVDFSVQFPHDIKARWIPGSESISPVEDANPTAQLASARASLEHAYAARTFIIRHLDFICNMLPTLVEGLPAEPPTPPARRTETELTRFREVSYVSEMLKFGLEPLPGFEIIPVNPQMLPPHLMAPLVFELDTDREIIDKIDRLAKEMNIPIEKFWRYLHFISSKPDYILHLQKESKKAH